MPGVNPRQGTDYRTAYHGDAARCRQAPRRQAVPQVRPARRVGCRRPMVPHVALIMLGLLAVLLVAVAPAYASGLGLAATGRIVIEDDALRDGSTDLLLTSTQVARPTDRPAELDRTPRSLQGTTADVTPPGGRSPVMAWYRQAAVEEGVGVDLLHALHDVESNAAPDGCLENMEGSGAVGPFQFKRATFRRYGVDGNHDGVRDICSFADALFSAARYLRALGADGLDDPQTRQALGRYGTDPDRVLTLARRYRTGAVRAS